MHEGISSEDTIRRYLGKKPLVLYLRTFECTYYAHVLDINRKKVNAKRAKCIVIVRPGVKWDGPTKPCIYMPFFGM